MHQRCCFSFCLILLPCLAEGLRPTLQNPLYCCNPAQQRQFTIIQALFTNESPFVKTNNINIIYKRMNQVSSTFIGLHHNPMLPCTKLYLNRYAWFCINSPIAIFYRDFSRCITHLAPTCLLVTSSFYAS